MGSSRISGTDCESNDPVRDRLRLPRRRDRHSGGGRGRLPRVDRAAPRVGPPVRDRDRRRPREHRGASMRRAAKLGLSLALLAGACTPVGSTEPERSPSVSPTGSGRPAVDVKTGSTTALQAMRKLCDEVDLTSPRVTSRPTPPSIAEVESQVETVRGLRFERPVNVEPVTPQEIDRRLGRYFDVYYPRRAFARRTLAWRTIGAIPPGIGILE